MIDAHAQTATEHDPWHCPCGPCFIWRLNVTDPADLDPTNSEESTMALFAHKPEPKPDPALSSTCAYCGVAAKPPDVLDSGPTPIPRDPWPLCVDCLKIISAHRGDSLAVRVTLLSQVLEIELDSTDDAAREVSVMLPTARQVEALGLPADNDALSLQRRGSAYRARPAGRGSAVPWQHVGQEDRARLREALRRAQRARQPGRCSDGPCGCCGRRLSVTWHGPDQMLPTTQGADRWPLCDGCIVILDRSGGSALVQEFREIMTGAAFGVPPMMGTAIVQPYAATCAGRAADAPGVAEPWSYITEEERRSAWSRFPRLAPREIRERRARADAARQIVAVTDPTPRSALDLSPHR